MRLEFWTDPEKSPSGDLAGHAYCENAYLAAALPRRGDLVSSDFVTGPGVLPGDPGALRHAHLLHAVPAPFIRVFAVEHYLARRLGRELVTPAVQVVFRLRAPASQEACDALITALEGKGWTVSGFGLGSPC